MVERGDVGGMMADSADEREHTSHDSERVNPCPQQMDGHEWDAMWNESA